MTTPSQAPSWSLLLLIVLIVTQLAVGQGSYTAQLSGVVADNSGAVIPNAKVTITDNGTNISTSVPSDGTGHYIFTSLRPTTYTLRVESRGFEAAVHKNLVLAVSQQATLNVTLKPAGITTEVQVTDTAPLLDTGSGSLGTEVTNEFVTRIPLQNRDTSQLVYLSAGVTQLNNADKYPYGTDFSSNGQRYGSAEIRLDGTLATGPEPGEGATTNLSYLPSNEVIQEFKVQNNSFSAEYGSNGGTIVNVLMKSGTNNFHGSGWWFGQRTALNANDFFSNRSGVPRSDSTRDQYGFSVTGPIIKNKTFFLFDLERVRQNDKTLVSGRVPTDLERQGDFSQTLTQDDNGDIVPVQLFNPRDVGSNGLRNPFPTNNVIPASLIDPVGRQLVNAYPEPTGPLDLNTFANFNKGIIVHSPSTQFDIKIDHQINEKMHMMGRYSQNNSDSTQPGHFFDGMKSTLNTKNIVLEHTWTMSPHLLLTSRFGVDRYFQNETSDRVDPTQFGLPSLLTQANGIVRMPEMDVDNYHSINPQCCVDTLNGHTQYIINAAMNWVHGKHVFKFGGESRIFFNNFYQPDYATGIFNFGKIITAQDPFGGSPGEQGTGIAGMLLGFPDFGQLNIKLPVENKSKQTAFYFQDDWKVTPRFTLNLGLRYDWSTPYTERFDRIEFSDFQGNSGITMDLTPPAADVNGDPILNDNGQPVNLSGLGLGVTQLKGITRFPDASHRHVPIDRNNFGPRLGFAYQLASNTVLRGGFGLFYGMSSATNFQYSGTAFRKDAQFHFTRDGGLTQFATLSNLFPNLPAGQLPQVQGKTYGPLANWGFGNGNDLGTETDHNAEIYQWNLGVQHLFPFGVVISADYSANRSTHLPWGTATRSRNILSTAARNACDTTCQETLVPNPFQSMFVGPSAIFNEPDSQYNFDSLALGTLLRPYPQFDGSFEGLPLFTASSWYNGLLFRFQKRPSHGLSFEGNYTISKATDYSSYGANYWIYFQGSNLGNPQDMNNLRAEHSIGANDTPQRFVLATVYDLPLGRGHQMGANMNRVLDGIVGGWSVNAYLTLQSGQPIPFAMSNSRLADGLQRPNLLCNPMSGISLHDLAFSTDPNANFYNPACFADPGDQVPGNAPRFSANARGEGIRNIDLGFFKDFTIREGMKLQLRAEFFNFTNSVRFATPFSSFGDSGFGNVTSQANTPRRTQVAVRFEF
jgi:Carboxypeptidase regulatory-like domain